MSDAHPEKSDNRRRRYWIDPGFQGRYLRKILMLELAVMAGTALVTFILAMALMNPDFEAGSWWNGIFGGFGVMATAFGAGLVYMGIRVSHKICGPALRIQLDLEAIRNGRKDTPITLRDGDELVELVQSINSTVEFLRTMEKDSDSSAAAP